jgi:anti-sigma factor RsiW
MADERLVQQMQEALDGTLSPEMTEQLWHHLDTDEEAADQWGRLQSIDDMLRTAPIERAPERIAVTIMARLAQSVQSQAEMEGMPEATEQALMLALSVVVLVMLPTMIAASWLVMQGIASPELLNQVLLQSIALLQMMIQALIILLEQVEALIREEPEMAAVATALIPVVLIGMLDYLQGDDDKTG